MRRGKLGLSIDEYNARWEKLLRRLGGSLATPSGWAEKGNYHSCARPQIFVPHPEKLTAVEREIIMLAAEQKYANR